MPYAVVEAFNLGVDRSRPIYAGPGGSLWEGINCHLSRGGDVEKRKAFVLKYSLPASTFGMCAVSAGLVVFGSAAAPAMPAGVTYLRLQHPTGQALIQVMDARLFGGLVYAVAKFADGSIHHFYDGTRVTYWETAPTKGTAALTHKNKMYTVGGSLVTFSKIGDPTDWAGTGFGAINLSNEYEGSETLKGLAAYQQRLAIFARRVVQVWSMASDPALNSPTQVIPETGAVSARSERSFGDIDVFYLSDTGIRSLRARDTIDVAGVSDVGNSIDPLVVAQMDALDDATIERAVSIVEPKEGRFWMALGDRIYVYSYFPAKKILAWTWYEPGFSVTDFATLNKLVYARADDSIYLYGGDDQQTYDSSRVTAQLPFLALGKPGTAKQLTGVDIAAVGEWAVTLLTNPNELAEVMHAGDLEGVTYTQDNIGAVGHSHYVAPLAIHESAGFASLSNVAIHYEGAEDE